MGRREGAGEERGGRREGEGCSALAGRGHPLLADGSSHMAAAGSQDSLLEPGEKEKIFSLTPARRIYHPVAPCSLFLCCVFLTNRSSSSLGLGLELTAHEGSQAEEKENTPEKKRNTLFISPCRDNTKSTSARTIQLKTVLNILSSRKYIDRTWCTLSSSPPHPKSEVSTTTKLLCTGGYSTVRQLLP